MGGADGGVGADEHALVALDAERGVPLRQVEGDGAFLQLGGGGGPAAVDRQGGDGQEVAFAGEQAGGDVAEKAGRKGGVAVGRGGGVGFVQRGGHGHLAQAGEGGVDGGVVHLHDLLALAGVGLGDRFLDVGDGLFLWEDAGEGEEAGLENGVGAAAHAGGLGDAVGVDHQQADLFCYDGLFPHTREFFPAGRGVVGRVEQQGGAGAGVAEDLVAADEAPLAAGHELGGADQPRRVDGLGAETQMRDGDGAGLFRVVDEIALGEKVGLFTDDLDRVFVRTDGAVRAEADEHAAAHAGGLELEGLVPAQGGVGDVVVDADGETVARAGGVQVGEHGLGHGGGELLRAEAVAAAEDARGRHGGGLFGAGEGAEDGQEERLADRAGLLGAVEHAEGAHGGREGGEEGLDREGLEESDRDHAHALAGGVEVVGGGLEGLDPGAHGDHGAFSAGVAMVVDE